MSELLFRSPDGVFAVFMKRDLYTLIQQHCVRSHPRETGGILIGCYSNDLKSASINRALGPPRKSVHQPTRFVRSSTGIKQILDSEWVNGNYYLGEWHYHPNALPTPSSQDIKQMLTFSNDKSLNCPEPILLIIGRVKNQWTLNLTIIRNKENIPLHYH